jgi:chemotaxis protein MotA
MDLATVIGLVLAWGALFAALLIEGGKPGELVNISAFVLVVGGTAGATIVTVSMEQVLGLPGVVKKALFQHRSDWTVLIRTMVEFAKKARKDGMLALESECANIENKFLKKGMQLIIDGTPSELVREVLETEIVAMQERHKAGETIFATAGGFAPTLGIIGTVMGLINMLSRLSEPGKMGHAIAAAFIATLYGVSLANLLFLPIGTKLKAKTSDEVITYEMILEGVLSIQAGGTPRMVEMKMIAFLPPKLRAGALNEPDKKELDKAA